MDFATNSSSRSNYVAPSNVPQTSQILAEVTELKFRKSQRLGDTPIPTTDAAWMKIVRLFQPNATQETNLEDIKQVMRNEYEHESDFNIALFLALRKCLERQGLIFPTPTNKNGLKTKDFPIVLRYGVDPNRTRWPRYAIGILREANGELTDEGDEQEHSNNSSGNRSRLALRARMDHSTSILTRESHNPWKGVACLSAVELKISNARNFASLKVVNDNVQEFALNINPGGATQVMMYTIGWVLASLGMIGQIRGSEGIPWSVIIGNKKPGNSTVSQLITRAISGKIYVPEACGARFEWNVTGYVPSNAINNKEENIAHAISIYFESLFFGLCAAKAWMDAPKPVTPHPTSGEKVMIGGQELTNLRLRGSASFPLHHPNEDTIWGVSQGEFFTGKVNIHYVIERLSELEKRQFLVFKAENREVDVVVKVSSTAVHGYLVHHDKAFLALKDILASDVDLSDVLFAVYHRPVGMVTIMADLSIEGYRDLQPDRDGTSLTTLWKGLKELVDSVLLPLANIGYIHPDLRPGFDITANILVRVDRETGEATMRLIDYESILLLEQWLRPSSADNKYIMAEAEWTCETFVWWQCFSIAYAWIERKKQREMLAIQLQELNNTQGTWLEPFIAPAATEKMDATHIENVFHLLGIEIRNSEARFAEADRQELIRREEEAIRHREARRQRQLRREEEASHQQEIRENERLREVASRAGRAEARQTRAETQQDENARSGTRSGRKHKTRK